MCLRFSLDRMVCPAALQTDYAVVMLFMFGTLRLDGADLINQFMHARILKRYFLFRKTKFVTSPQQSKFIITVHIHQEPADVTATKIRVLALYFFKLSIFKCHPPPK
jgi:hypothetical protein